jgi:hypothetical protein
MAALVTKSLTDELSLRLEDPKETKFPVASKIKFLNRAQIRLCNMLHPAYLTELEGATSTSQTYNTHGFSLTSPALNGNLGLLLSGRGVRRVKFYKNGTGNGVWATELSLDELKKVTNQFLLADDESPRYYIFKNNIFLLVTTYTSAKVDVHFIKQPTLMVADTTDPVINASLFPILTTLAEAMLWGMRGQLEKRNSAMKFAFDEIQTLNARYEPAEGVGTKGREERR